MTYLKILAILFALDVFIILEFIQSERRRKRREFREMINEIFNTKKETIV